MQREPDDVEPEDGIDDRCTQLPYRDPAEINAFDLSNALCTLSLLGGDPYLRMQTVNLSVVDQFIMGLEYETLRKLHDEESTPMPETLFLSAQSQMWIFAAYEILRTWRQRSKEALKLAENGGLQLKIDSLEKELGYIHASRQMRARQLRKFQDDPIAMDKVQEDLRAIHIPFARIEYVRVALAKHEVSGKPKSIAYAPGYGRINSWCGSLDYEIGTGSVILDTISRRDIADELRAIADRSHLPTNEDLASFDKFMKESPTDPFS